MVAVTSTVLAIPMLLVEIAGGADASPDPRPVESVAAEVVESISPAVPDVAAQAQVTSADPDAPKAVVSLSGDELAAPRLLGVFGRGDELRAQAAAEEEEAELAREAEEERLRRIEEREAAAEAARKAEQDRIAAERAAQQRARIAAEEAAANPPAPATPPPGGPSAAQWHALRQCESGNNYQAISPNKLYYGAYQFYRGTWDNTARNSGRTDLVGVRPDQASPADQDAMAFALYQSRGHSPWPHCGVHLR